MIFTPHIIAGAVIGAKTQNLGLIIISGLLIHFIMDKLPHWDYPVSGVENFKKEKNFKNLFIDFIKIGIDGLIGLLIVFIIMWQKNILNLYYLPFILFAIFVSILPDIILGLSALFAPKKIIKKYFKSVHYKFLHYKKEKEGKITFLELIIEILITIIACVLLLNL